MKKILKVLEAFMHMGGKPHQLAWESAKLAFSPSYRNDWYETVTKKAA
jgi:hypothetical protein